VSYILDALRKSEQQRQHGLAPRLLTVHATSEANTQPAFLKYGLIAAVLIGAGVVVGGLHPWQQAQRLSATESTPTKMLESSPPQSLPAPLPVLRNNQGTRAEKLQEALVAAKTSSCLAATIKQAGFIKTPVHTSKLPPKLLPFQRKRQHLSVR
jgi:hypothetical protein